MRIAVDEAVAYPHEAFGQAGEVRLFSGRSVTRRDLLDVDAVVVRSVTTVDSRLLEGTTVRFVGTATIGTDHLDLDYLNSRNIQVANAAGCNSNAVAEYVFTALTLIAARKGWNLREKSIGVIGAGNIGSRVARKAAALGMKVSLCDPPLREKTGDLRYGDLADVLDADILTLHVPFTAGGRYRTLHMFNREVFRQLRRCQLIVNTSRGAVVAGPDLLEALQARSIAGAVLDVWEGEPEIDPGLLDLVDIATPHIAGYSLDGKLRATLMIANQLCAFLGIRQNWTASGVFPPPRALAPVSGTEGFDAVRSVLQQAYDICRDDRALRGIKDLSRNAAADYFESLRMEYGFRLEFAHFVVTLPAGSALAAMFRALEFQVEAAI